MALKNKFKKKEIEVVSAETKEEKKEQIKLELLQKHEEKHKKKNATALDLTNLKNLSSSEGNDPLLERKLNCYHKINELYQSNSLTLFNLMKGVLEIISVGVEAQGGSLWIMEEEGTGIICKVAIGPGSEKVVGINLEVGQGVVGWVAEHKKSQIVYDTSLDERFKNKKNVKDNNVKTMISTPLIYNDEIIGVIQVVNKDENCTNHLMKYTDDDKFFLEDLSTLVAMHIKTKRVLKNQDSLIHRMQNFADLHEKFSSTIDLDELLVMVLKKAINLVEAEVGSIWLVEESGEGIVCSYAEGPTKDKVEGLKLKRGVGIIGQIIDDQKGKLVEDCSKDKNFSKVVDNKTSFVTRSMVASPFTVKGECIGAIQILNKKGNRYFNNEDLDLLNLFGSSAAMYIKNARLFNSEKKAKDLSSLIEIGKQITSTLDLDSVLATVVNLSSQVIPYDEAHISNKKIGSEDKVSLRAISGQQEIDLSETKNKAIENIHNHLIKKELKSVYIESKEKIDVEKHGQIIATYLEENEIESFWAQVLEDDQGMVGVLTLESSEGYLINHDREEILSILSSQSTVALRNVELYNTIPSSQFMKNIQAKILSNITNFFKLGWKTHAKLGLAMASIIAALIFIKLPHNISANIEILPHQLTHFSQGEGIVKSILVKEGSYVYPGDLLLELDVEDLKINLLNKQSQLRKAKTEMFDFKQKGNIADYKIKEAEYLSMEYEIELLQKKIDASKIYASSEGVIISEDLEDLVGKPVNFGQELIKMAKQDQVIVKFEVPEESIMFVKPEQEIKFKLYGNPNESFSEGMKLKSVSGEARQVIESDPTKYYMAKSLIKIDDAIKGKVRPGMTGRGKIYGEKQSLLYLLFSKLYYFLVMEVFF